MAKETVGYLPGSDPETMKQNMNYQAALERMEQALMARQNRMFDPQMMALASGFLAPTQTGGFGESLGLAAKNVREAQMQEEKEEREIAQAQLGLAGQGLELERRRQRAKMFLSDPSVSGALPAPSGQPPVSGALTQQPKTSTTGALPSGEPVSALKDPSKYAAIPFSQPNPAFLASDSFMRSAFLEGKMDLSEAQLKRAELEKKRYIESQGNVIDLGAGIQYVNRSGPPVEIQIFDVANKRPYENTFKVDPGTAAQLAAAAAEGSAEKYKQIADRVMRGPFAGLEEAKPSEEKPSEQGRRQSVQELEIKLESEKKLASKLAETEAEQQSAIVNEGRRAGSTIQLGNQLIQLASSPDANQIYGLARNNENAMAMFTNLLGSGIQLGGGYSISVPELSNIYRTFKFTPEQQQQYQFFLQKARQMAIMMSEFAKGSVSNYEQVLFTEASINENDLPGTIKMKAEAMNARANFEKERAALLRSKDSNGNRRFKTTDSLYDSSEYKNLVNELDKKYEAILTRNGLLKEAQQSATPSGKGLTADQIRQEAAERRKKANEPKKSQ